MLLKPDSHSHHRLLLTAGIPFLLLVIAVPVSQRLAPVPQQIGANTDTDRRVEMRVQIQAAHRMAAADVVRRMEAEYEKGNGEVSMTPLDFKRLRNALR